MSEVPFEPTYLRQGSCLMVFTTPEAAEQAHETCVTAFYGNQYFAGFTLRPPQTPLPDWMRNGQPCHPWLIKEHRCIIFGIAALAKTPLDLPDLKEIMILNDPPILVGNDVRSYGLHRPRITQVHLTETQKYGSASNLVVLPTQIVA